VLVFLSPSTFTTADLIFLSGISMVFRVAAALLADHKEMLLQCRNFEQLMDYFKTTLPCMGATQLERVIHEVIARIDANLWFMAHVKDYHLRVGSGSGVGYWPTVGGL
jgi:TBC1 domain family member 4